MATKNKNIKVRDLKPRKDAKGGGGIAGATAGSTKGAGALAGGQGTAGAGTAGSTKGAGALDGFGSR